MRKQKLLTYTRNVNLLIKLKTLNLETKVPSDNFHQSVALLIPHRYSYLYPTDLIHFPNINSLKNILFVLLMFSGFSLLAQQCPLIPLPNEAAVIPGNFFLSNNTPIISKQPAAEKLANFLQQQLLKNNGLTLAVLQRAGAPAITLNIDNTTKLATDEGYLLDIKPSGINITAVSEHGLFYGIISLIQLAQIGTLKNDAISINCWKIKDAPRYAWRGLLLDESRHFFGKQTVKEMLDWMAFYKLNKFHWHLTDQTGWRIEIQSFPLLTLIGGIGSFSDKFSASQYYSQEDIKEIIAYASERFIDVIPEIDMPGHATAANKAYPAFSGGGSEKNPEFTFNPGLDTTYTYLTKILKETDALFPSQMIHLGGDEVHFGNEQWKTNAGIKQLMQKNKLPDLVSVEHYFTQRMADSLFKLNNNVLLWDEAVDGNLPKDKTVIFWWRHDKPAQLKKALDKGYAVVLCPRLPFYFDFVQHDSQAIGRRWGGRYATLDTMYNFNTSALAVGKDQQNQILGVQGALWTEVISTKSKLDYMLFPRITALAELGWTSDTRKNLADFNERVKLHLELYKQSALYYYDPFRPELTPEPFSAREIIR